MNATVYFLIEDNEMLQFSCHGQGPYMFHQPNVDPGPQSAQRGWTQDTNCLMSNINIAAITPSGGWAYTLWGLNVQFASQRETKVDFVCVKGKLHCELTFFSIQSPLFLYLSQIFSDRLI